MVLYASVRRMANLTGVMGLGIAQRGLYPLPSDAAMPWYLTEMREAGAYCDVPV